MERFVVRKNTLPYVHQWAVVDTETAKKVGEYKTKKLADKACSSFRHHGLSDGVCGTKPNFENVWNAMSKRMEHPDGDPLPKPKKKPRHSYKRKVELD